MNVRASALPEVLVIEPRVFRDDRGFFYESYHSGRFADAGLRAHFVQDNRSRSARGVLRGLHYQLRQPQGKLVACTRGRVFDVAVDVRRGSPTFGRWTGLELSEDEPRLLWIPPGFAHGFCALSDVADVSYKCTALYAPDDDRGVRWNDPRVGISWPVAEPVLSEKDRGLPALSDDRADLPSYP